MDSFNVTGETITNGDQQSIYYAISQTAAY